jgi:CheY-like chemotaxis protein
VPAQSTGDAPLRILVAEDNEINALVLAKYLRKAGHRPCIARNGEEAVEKAQQERFDVIFMDVHMPVMDGLEATRRIRESGVLHSSTVDIIALTADAMPEDRQRCLDAGMTDYLSKPVNFAELDVRLKKTLVAQPVET